MPYINTIYSVLSELLGWIKYLIGIISLVKIAQYALEYQKGDSVEKAQAVRDIRKTFEMGGGFFFLLWLGQYIFDKMANV